MTTRHQSARAPSRTCTGCDDIHPLNLLRTTELFVFFFILLSSLPFSLCRAGISTPYPYQGEVGNPSTAGMQRTRKRYHTRHANGI